MLSASPCTSDAPIPSSSSWTFACLPAHQHGPFFTLEEVTLKKQPALLDPSSLPRTISHRILPSRSLDRSKSAPLKSRVVILLFALFPPHRILNSITSWSLQSRQPLTFTSTDSSSLFVTIRSSTVSFVVSSPMTCARQLSSVHYSRNFLDCLHAAVFPL